MKTFATPFYIWGDLIEKGGMAVEAATDKAFKRADEIFATYPITQS
jgi:hypothetical protein